MTALSFPSPSRYQTWILSRGNSSLPSTPTCSHRLISKCNQVMTQTLNPNCNPNPNPNQLTLLLWLPLWMWGSYKYQFTHQETKLGLKLTARHGCRSVWEQTWDLLSPPFCSGVGVDARKSVAAGRRNVQLTQHNSVLGWLPWFPRLQWNGWKTIFPRISVPPNTQTSFNSSINISTI